MERQYAQNVGSEMGCDVTSLPAMVQCLKKVNGRKLRAVADRVYPGYSVSVDGTFLRDTPYNLYERGEFQHITLLAGFNGDEGTIRVYGENPGYVGSDTPPPISRSALEESIRTSSAKYGLGDPLLQESMLHEYTNWTVADDPDADFFRELVDFHGDFDFICPTNAVSRLHAITGDTVFQYYMTHKPSMSYLQYGSLLPPTPWLGASHLEDLAFVWGAPFIGELDGIHSYNLSSEEKILSVEMMTMWTNFAKMGIPGDIWPRFTVPELQYQELSPVMGEGRAARARQCHFWSSYLLHLKSYTDAVDDVYLEWQESYTAWKEDIKNWRDVFEEHEKEIQIVRDQD